MKDTQSSVNNEAFSWEMGGLQQPGAGDSDRECGGIFFRPGRPHPHTAQSEEVTRFTCAVTRGVPQRGQQG